MSEKRFRVNDLVKFNYSEVGEYVDENHTDRPLRNDEVVDKLNEQQSAITKLKELNDNKGKMIISLIRTNKTLKEKNEQLKQYKLYEDNKRLQTIIADLKEENEQLRKELDNFKPVMFQDMRKGTIILYSKGD